MNLSKKLNGSIIEHFKKAVNKHPDKIAVKSEDDTVSYKELDKLSDNLASVIISELGIGSEPVIFCLEYGVTSVIAILGILKAGKFYTALDKAYSESFISYIIEDTETKLIITDKASVSLLPKHIDNNAKILFIEDILLSHENKENINIKLNPDMPAALLYTSGSTGQPKGIIKDHSLVMHSTWHIIKDYNITSEDYILNIFSFSFGMSIANTFDALFSSVSLYLYDIRKKRGAGLYEILVREKITVFSPPVSNILKDIRLIRLGGDHLYLKDIKNIRKYISEDCLIVNAFGSSEAGIITCFFIDKNILIKDNKIPVGYPPEYKEILILDEAGNKVCDGEVGEIAVKSRYLASGYWKDSELTEKKFLSDSIDKTKRIYLTGDLGRIKEDGCLEYVGRKDFMVKIRGYRVEIEAIEAALLSLYYIKEAAVKAFEEEDTKTKYLTAYIVYASDLPPAIAELREDLKKILPDYMIPSYFVMLEKIPYTASFKIDRKALPAPVKRRPEFMPTYVAPVTELEKKLAKIWTEILGIDKVGIDDNFFALGGNSIIGVRLAAEIEKNIDMIMSAEALIKFSTITGMAKAIRKTTLKKPEQIKAGGLSSKEYLKMLATVGGSGLSTIKPGSLITGFNLKGVKTPLFWCAVAYNQHPMIVRYLEKEHPVYGIFSGQKILWSANTSKEHNNKYVKRIASYYINEILKIKTDKPYILGGNCGGAWLAAEIAFGLMKIGKKVEKICMVDWFDERFFEYDGKALLIYAGESHMNPKKFFGWGKEGWEKKFISIPKVYIIPGIKHGGYFNEPYLEEMCIQIKEFLNN